jgi:hypothetical protein
MPDLSSIAIQDCIDLEQLRTRLRKMTDAELRRFGKAAKFMCSPGANLGTPPRECFVIQLEETRAEWRRRRVEAASADHNQSPSTEPILPRDRIRSMP